MSEPLAGSLSILLKNLGFSRGNPFASLEAGKEEGQEWFYESFVEPPRFDEIVGDARSPQPMLVFAPRGSGKTALRVMVHYYCRRGYVPGGQVLSLSHTDLSLIQEAARTNPQADLGRVHVEAILRAGIVALARQVGESSSLARRLAQQPAEEQTYLRWFVNGFGRDLSPAQWRALAEVALADRPAMGRRPSPVPALHAPPESGMALSYVRLLHNFVGLVRGLGFQAVYVLVDGADELATTAAEFGYAARLIEPLAANLKLLDTPGVAFRLFLPAEIRPYLEALESVRRDRIVWYDLVWQPERLLALLYKRLDVFSEGRVPALDPICADDLPPGYLERAMVEAADGSPRTLLRLGQEMLRQQAALVGMDEQADWLLRKEAWERTLDAVFPPRETPPPPAPKPAPGGEPESPWPRILATYPSPIALVCRDYLNQQAPMARLHRLLDAFEATVSFCGVLMLAQYRQQVEEARRQGQQARSLKSAVDKKCRLMTLGRWLWLLERLTGLSSSLGETLIGRQLQRLLEDESGTAIQRLRELRNQVAHQAQPPAFYEEHLPPAHADLLAVLTALDFLAETVLFQPVNIEKHKDGYSHVILRYQGDNPLFTREKWVLTKPRDCDKIWFSHSNGALALFPFLIAEQCPACGHHELFVYQRLADDNLIYHNFASGHSLTTARYRPVFADLLGF